MEKNFKIILIFLIFIILWTSPYTISQISYLINGLPSSVATYPELEAPNTEVMNRLLNTKGFIAHRIYLVTEPDSVGYRYYKIIITYKDANFIRNFPSNEPLFNNKDFLNFINKCKDKLYEEQL